MREGRRGPGPGSASPARSLPARGSRVVRPARGRPGLSVSAGPPGASCPRVPRGLGRRGRRRHRSPSGEVAAGRALVGLDLSGTRPAATLTGSSNAFLRNRSRYCTCRAQGRVSRRGIFTAFVSTPISKGQKHSLRSRCSGSLSAWRDRDIGDVFMAIRKGHAFPKDLFSVFCM